MTDTFLLAIPEDPAPCRAAAEGLRSLASTADHTADLLDTQVSLSPDDFSGVTARAYRAACGDLRADVRLLARDARGLADALVDYVDGIREVRRVLHQVRRRAVLEQLEVLGEEVHLPECPEPAQAQAFRVLLGLRNRAHMAASWVESDWMSALERHTGAAPTGLVAYPPLGTWPPQPGEYPYDAGVPGLGVGPLPPLEEQPDDEPDRRVRAERPSPTEGATDLTTPSPSPPPPAGPATPVPAPACPDPAPGQPDARAPDRVSMSPTAVGPLPPLLPLLPDPAAHGPCPTGYEGVLT